MTNDPGERPLTVPEVAELLRCHPDTVRNLYRSGQLRITRVGRLVRVPHDALREFLADPSTDPSTTDERTDK